MASKKTRRISSVTRKTHRRARDRFGRFLPAMKRDERGRFVKRRELPPPRWYTPDWQSPKERRKARAAKARIKKRAEKSRTKSRESAIYKDGVEYRTLFSCDSHDVYMLEEFLGNFVPDKNCMYKISLDTPLHYGIYLSNASIFKLRSTSDVQRLMQILEQMDLQSILNNSDGVKKKALKTKRGRKRRTARKVRICFVEIERV